MASAAIRLQAVSLKYFEVARTSLRSKTAYWFEQLISMAFLVAVVVIFSQLWAASFAGAGSTVISGYTYPEMVWYIVFTEAIILALPRVDQVIQREVRDGDLAIRLNKPYEYLLFHYFSFLGEGLFRGFLVLLVGGASAWWIVGGIDFRWEALSVALLVFVVTQALNFFYNSWIGLAAFWVEDVTGIFFVLDRLKWLLGGFFFPLDIFPDWLRSIMAVLPFQYMIYAPARLMLKFDWQGFFALAAAQAFWLAVVASISFGLYRLGVRKVDINGG